MDIECCDAPNLGSHGWCLSCGLIPTPAGHDVRCACPECDPLGLARADREQEG